MRTLLKRLFAVTVSALVLFPGSSRSGNAGAEEIVAVLSSHSGYYREAYKGFQDNLGKPVLLHVLPESEPSWNREAKIALAFGAKATLQHYPSHVLLIYCMAPGAVPDPQKAPGPAVKVHMLPRSIQILGKLKEIQPAMKNLLLFWVSEPMEDNVREMKSACASLGIRLTVKKLKDADQLADELRSLRGRPDAIWIPPDPLLINAQSFAILKGYSWSNNVPFYAPNEGLVEKGATACVSSSFYEIGKTAALAANQAALDRQAPKNYYPESMEIFINQKSAQNCNLDIPADVLRKAARLFQ